MIDIQDYYKLTHKTAGNSKDFELFEQNFTAFPREGIYIGEYETHNGNKAPALIPIDQTNGICFLSTPNNSEQVKKTMQMMALRLAMTLPAGLCKFTLFDASGLGMGLISLSKLSNKIKGESILYETKDLKASLQEAKVSIPKTIQGVLGAKYADKTLVEYNEDAGELAKPYHFIILTDVPTGLDRETGELLNQVVKGGRKAGIFVIMNLDSTYEKKHEYDYDPLPLLDVMTTIYEKDKRFYINNIPNQAFLNKFILKLDKKFPDAEEIEDIELFINENLKKAQNVAVSLADVLTEKRIWTKDASNGVEVPIGKANLSEVQNFALSVEDGSGQSYHHCLLGGSTGSGKTVLLHNIICNTSWLYSPAEVQFLLLDFKEGTEFMVYKNLPNVKVLSIKSEMEFAMNVFEFLEDEITRRGELFKEAGVANIRGYNAKASVKLPRYIIVIDEFQKLFDTSITLADKFGQKISDIGKRGRSFGINMILSTQGLGGLNVGNALSEFGLRVSMRLNSDMECNRILGQGNMAPRTLTKKGESVYCPGGNAKDNVIYQVAYMSDNKIKDTILHLQDKYLAHKKDIGEFSRYIFDGESPADISDNQALKQKLTPQKGKINVYIGSPFALVDEHFSYTLQKENGYNVLAVGQDIGSATSIFFYSMKQIIEQSPAESRFIVCDKTNPDSPFYGKLSSLTKMYKGVKVVEDDAEIAKYIMGLSAELEKRKNAKGDYPRFVMALFNAYNFRPARMRQEMTTTITRKLVELLTDGPDFGIHLLCYVDTYTHYGQIFGPRTLADWRIKIELRGGDAYHIFGSSRLSAPTVNNPYTASVRTAEMEESETTKIRVYNI